MRSLALSLLNTIPMLSPKLPFLQKTGGSFQRTLVADATLLLYLGWQPIRAWRAIPSHTRVGWSITPARKVQLWGTVRPELDASGLGIHRPDTGFGCTPLPCSHFRHLTLGSGIAHREQQAAGGLAWAPSMGTSLKR